MGAFFIQNAIHGEKRLDGDCTCPAFFSFAQEQFFSLTVLRRIALNISIFVVAFLQKLSAQGFFYIQI